MLTDDPSTRLVAYLSFSTGGGVSNTGSPCSRSKLGNKRSTSGCGVVNEYGGAIQCSNVSMILTYLENQCGYRSDFLKMEQN